MVLIAAARSTFHVRSWHGAEVFGDAAISSGYRGTYTVPARQPACVLVPSRPGGFHPEPLTNPDGILSHHPARATA